MKKIFGSVAIMTVLLIILFEILLTSNEIMEAVTFSIIIWKNNIFPSLFPFFVLSEILINFGLIEIMGELFKPIMQKLFRLNSSSAFVFVMSIFTGFPSSARYTKELYNNGLLNRLEATKILLFSHFSNPLFILGSVSLLFLKNKEVGILILFCHYFTNILIGLIFRNYAPSKEENLNISLKRAIINMHKKRMSNKKSFGEIFTTALVSSINTLLLILGVITIFLVITTIIDTNLNISTYNQAILNGFVEMTQGLKYISLLDIPLKLKTVLSTMIISFGGFSVHTQVMTILSDTDIKYLPFLTARIIHALISSIMCFILFDIWIMYI